METNFMSSKVIVKNNTYAGIFMVTLSTLMYEILLTRIFSVTMWYHFAFMAISIAMFGMTLGAILVYIFPVFFTHEKAKYHLSLSSLLFAITIVFSFLTHLSIPFDTAAKTIVGFYSIALTYAAISVPFLFSGICVCLALTKFPRQVSKLYAADLAGAAIGCILIIYILKITDGPTSVIVTSFFACIGAVFFVIDEAGFKKLKLIAYSCMFLFAIFIVINTIQAAKQSSLLRITWMKGQYIPHPLYEKWNSFSYIRVSGNPDRKEDPFGWGFSPVYPSDQKVSQLYLDIDSNAKTVLTAFNGDLNNVEYLKYDVTNLAHYIRPESKVLVVGAGGGRDILSALVFKQKQVVGVEINDDIISTVNQKFGDFTGHLDKYPQVAFVNDEARSYIARQKDKFDILQVSLIDTWAATTSGAFVLSENSLYTLEAWKIFLDHITPDGVLTFSRWYFRDLPGETYRIASLASASLRRLGIDNPRHHIIIVRCMWWRVKNKIENLPDGIGTILVSKKPFSESDIDTIEKIAKKMQFEIVLSPRYSSNSVFETISEGKNLDNFFARFPINIAPPTDDSPFFFNMLRIQDAFNTKLRNQGTVSFNMIAVFVLTALLIIVLGLTFLCIIVPLIITSKKVNLKGSLFYLIFFASIGFGFMFVEISQMQRLIIFLGHPTYSLSVVLFTLLLSSGLGSYLTYKIDNPRTGVATIRLFLLLCALTFFGILTPYAITAFEGSTTMLRILVAAVILFPLGLFMGMAFPLGMKLASAKSASLTPWLWGINGATSVCASVVAVVIALSSSISTSFWTGFSCYVLAFISFLWISRGNS